METWKGFVLITELSGLSFCPFHKYQNANLPDCTSEWGSERLQSWGFCICNAFCEKIITEVKCVSILYPLKKKKKPAHPSWSKCKAQMSKYVVIWGRNTSYRIQFLEILNYLLIGRPILFLKHGMNISIAKPGAFQ